MPDRYSTRPFPAYRFVPGTNPHPTRDPGGHSYGEAPENLASFDAQAWHSCEPYLYSVDLFNGGFWWEAHENLEVVWSAAGRRTRAGAFIQGLIQVSVAYLKEEQEFHGAARRMAWKGLDKLGGHRGRYLGIDVADFQSRVKTGFAAVPVTPAKIDLK